MKRKEKKTKLAKIKSPHADCREVYGYRWTIGQAEYPHQFLTYIIYFFDKQYKIKKKKAKKNLKPQKTHENNIILNIDNKIGEREEIV